MKYDFSGYSLSLGLLFLFLGRILAILIALTLHEFLKVFLSKTFGDNSAKTKKAFTLNPFKHNDFLGFILFMIFGYGWSKPADISIMSYEQSKRKTHALIVYSAPIVLNFVLGFLFAFLYYVLAPYVGMLDGVAYDLVNTLLQQLAVVNMAFALVSLIPVYPMSGFKILTLALKPAQVVKYVQYEKIFQLVFVLFIVFGFAARVFDPIVNTLLSFVMP